MNYHAMSAEGVLQKFGVQVDQGLDSTEVRKRRAAFGLNKLEISPVKSSFRILIDQLKSLLILLLIIAAVLSAIFSDFAESFAIVVVIIINISIGFWAETKAIHSMAALRKMGQAVANVLRNGQSVSVEDDKLVPGDIIMLEAGDVVTADVRIIESHNLQCNESLLTGESVPIAKITDMLAENAPLYDRRNMLFRGTSITQGSCKGVVVATGSETELGEISSLTHSAEASVSPLEIRLAHLSAQLLIAVLLITFIVVAVGIYDGREIVLITKTGIALAVAAIPEGLPIVATLSLARGMWKLAKNNALIERLSAVETLGSVNVIFTDKTGTLTENSMSATSLTVPDDMDKNQLSNPDETGKRALRVCSLCHSRINHSQLSDPLETALVKAAEILDDGAEALEKAYPTSKEIPFDPNVRMMATIHKDGEDFLYLVKGAPETVLANSDKIAHPKEDQLLTADEKAHWSGQITKLAQDGYRVLALAEKRNVRDSEEPYEKLTFLGVISLNDPPRKDALAATIAAQKAGIRVIMVTGDNLATAVNIANAVGIENQKNGDAIEGSALKPLNEWSEHEIENVLSAYAFARVSPQQKLDLIDIYQKNGAVVAMTGDGVNDAPALKKADVGIAMGKRGTEVAKQAADIILKDDAFSSIVIAIKQGRIIFSNIRKFVIYLLSCNLSEVLVVTCCMFAGLPLPLLPLQILFLNLVTDTFPALALGFGRGDKKILDRPPRSKAEGILTNDHWVVIIFYAILMTVTVIGAFYWAIKQPGQSIQYGQSVAFLTLALTQIWHVFNMGSRDVSLLQNQITKNPYIWLSILVCIILLSVAILWLPLARLLQLELLDQKGWIVVIIASLLPLFIIQVFKKISLTAYPVKLQKVK